MGRGIGVGDRVGIYLDGTEWMYVALLGVTKAGAAYVPLNDAMPTERLCFISRDAQLRAVLTDRAHAATIAAAPTSVIALDAIADQLDASPSDQPADTVSEPATTDAYIIYTSGSTGVPKGVVITQRNITTFLAAVLPVYGIQPSDRVYQGIPLSFDFSVEEIWLSWAAGATLVARPSGGGRLGSELNGFLTAQRVSILHIVPTLLATLDEALPTVRLINVGGEACPSELVDRFATSGRTMLNTYGLSETTVTATWARLLPGLPVTIGRPLPSHSTYVLDAALGPVERGQEGELCIGGPCVAAGYLNRDALTAEQFVADPFSAVRGARMYRTGDLVRINPAGDIEFLGRMDTQVKLRGYRVELGEVEAVIAADPAVRQAVVGPLGSDGRVEELAAYVVLGEGDPEEMRRRIHRSLKRRLPSYMVPAYIEVLDSLPLQPGGAKLDRSSLPLPSGGRLVDLHTDASAVTATEQLLSAAWGEVMGLDQVPVDADFFFELGGHSFLAALVMERLRRDPSTAEFEHRGHLPLSHGAGAGVLRRRGSPALAGHAWWHDLARPGVVRAPLASMAAGALWRRPGRQPLLHARRLRASERPRARERPRPFRCGRPDHTRPRDRHFARRREHRPSPAGGPAPPQHRTRELSAVGHAVLPDLAGHQVHPGLPDGGVRRLARAAALPAHHGGQGRPGRAGRDGQRRAPSLRRDRRRREHRLRGRPAAVLRRGRHRAPGADCHRTTSARRYPCGRHGRQPRRAGRDLG